MKVYSKKYHRNVERQVHFGVGKSVKTACGLVLFARHVAVNIHSGSDGAIITDKLNRVTCKNCLNSKETRLRKLIKIESLCPGIFDRATLCGEDWLLRHGLSVSKETIDEQKLELVGKGITLTNNTKAKDRIYLLKKALKD